MKKLIRITLLLAIAGTLSLSSCNSAQNNSDNADSLNRNDQLDPDTRSDRTDPENTTDMDSVADTTDDSM